MLRRRAELFARRVGGHICGPSARRMGGERGGGSGQEQAAGARGQAGPGNVESERFDGRHLPPWAEPLQRHLRSQAEPGKVVRGLDAGLKDRAFVIWRATLKDNLGKLERARGREEEVMAAIDDRATQLLSRWQASEGQEDGEGWHVKHACYTLAAYQSLCSLAGSDAAALEAMAALNGAASVALRGRIKRFSFFVAKNLFRRNLYWEDVGQLVALGYGLGPSFRPSVLVSEEPDSGVELQLRACVYRDMYDDAGCPELLCATCCEIDAGDFQDAERYGHRFKHTRREGVCCLALGKDLSAFPLDRDSADVDEIALYPGAVT